ncbi:MAG: helix-turn-helix domain-containing protein [Solirubrobacteraceae bacterium]
MPETASPPLLLTVREVGRMLGQSRTSVYRLIDGRRLPTVKIGASVRIPREAVERLVAELLDERPVQDESPGGEPRLPNNPAGLGRNASRA